MEKTRNIVIAVPECNCSECGFSNVWWDGELDKMECTMFDEDITEGSPCQKCLDCTEKKNGYETGI